MARKPPARTKALPAPVGGWNARDALGAMPISDAVTLVNLFPATTDVRVRFGHLQWKTGFAAQIQTLMSYSGAATDKLKAIAGGSVYDATSTGAVGAAELSGLSNSKWQYVNVTTSGGNFIEMCNGADSVYTYNGTTWTDQSGNITGVTSSTLININVHKDRVWFIQKDTLKAWYLPVKSISGAANALDLSAFAPHGGYLMAMGTWTVDAGFGLDDLAVFVTSNGDIIVYRGTDPSSASTWALVGVFYSGSPIGRRCLTKYKGDLLLICQDGLVPLSTYLQSDRLDPSTTLTNKIQFATSQAISSYGANFGWQVLLYPGQSMLFLNVPYDTTSGQQQFVMNTITGSWCNFQNWSAACWELFQDDPYFGTNTYVGKAWQTNADVSDDITFDGLQAFYDFGATGNQKRFTMIRPTLFTNGSPTIVGNINLDYDTSAPVSTLSITPSNYGHWDTALWDTGIWGESLSVSRAWQGASGTGYVGAPRIKGGVNGLELRWIDTTVTFEEGGIL